MNILVTGGAGYIGSHTVLLLKKMQAHVVVLDNLSKGHREAVAPEIPLVVGDIHDQEAVTALLKKYAINAVVHFAAYSLVGESMQDPAKYYENNVGGTLSLLEAMGQAGVKKIVFSSTAAVYGEPEKCPISETFSMVPTNVYGRTKLVIEGMLRDFDRAYGLKSVALRYFNAAGAAPDGVIGEDHHPETHLIPIVLEAALGLRSEVQIYGSDYPTKDGTCVRDYIHVTDLAQAHALALRYLLDGGSSRAYNLGSETGFTVHEVIDTARKVTGVDFPVTEASRRSGDPAMLVASSAAICRDLGWKPQAGSLGDIIRSAWQWHKTHPNGYGK